MREDHELPAVDATALAMAYGAAVMEQLHPGFLDRWVELAESDAVHAEIRRLREPTPNVELTEILRQATVLVRHIRFVALAHISTERRRRKGR